MMSHWFEAIVRASVEKRNTQRVPNQTTVNFYWPLTMMKSSCKKQGSYIFKMGTISTKLVVGKIALDRAT